MAETLSSAVDLSDMTDKQLAKEFKSVGKQIKSKDLDVKLIALQKLTDLRYFTIGGCLVPLVESMIPKKKVTVENERLLGIFETFVGQPSFTGSPNSGVVQQSLKFTLNSVGDLNFLRVVSDMMLFKEELKAPKLKKGGPIELMQENDGAVNLRYNALKVLCSITSSLTLPNSIDSVLAESLASVTSLAESVCLVLENLRIRFDDQSTKDGMLQEGIWGLSILVFILRNHPSTINILLFGDVLLALREFIREESMSLFCLQIFELISLRADCSFSYFLDEELVLCISDAVLKATEEPTNRADITSSISGTVAATPGKGKSAKRDKAAVLSDANSLPLGRNDKADIFKQTRRQKIACINLAANTLSAICEKNGHAVSPLLIKRLVPYFAKILSDRTAWELALLPTVDPYDVNLSDTFYKCCIFIGAAGLIDSPQRRSAYDASGVSVLLTVMQNSMAIFNCTAAASPAVLQSLMTDDVAASLIGKKEKVKVNLGSTLKGKITETVKPGIGTPAEEAEKLRKVRTLRRVCEKALLALVSEKSELVVLGAGLPMFTNRWHSASFGYKVDLSLFIPLHGDDDRSEFEVYSGTNVIFPISQLIEVISGTADIDLGNRGLRVLSALLGGVDDPVMLMTALNLDPMAISALSGTVHARTILMLETLDVKRKKEANSDPNFDAFLDLNATKDSVDDVLERSTVMGSVDDPSIAAGAVDRPMTVVGVVDILLPSEGEALYLSLLILEIALHISAAAVNTFATRDRLAVFGSLLYRCGVTGNQQQCDITEERTDPLIPECEVSLHDPRNYTWCASEREFLPDKVLLRPLIFDIVGLIASAEETYRVYEAEVPLVPTAGAPLLAYSSPCREAALCAAKLCGDAAVSSLLVHARYDLQPSRVQGLPPHIIALANTNMDVTLELSVLDAALGSLLAMTSLGAIGLYAVLESVAEAGFTVKETKPDNNKSCAMNGFRRFLSNLTTSSVLQSDDETENQEATDSLVAELKACLSLKITWTRALFFDQLFSGLSFDTAPSTVLRNPAMWPYLTVCAAVIGCISSVQSAYTTITCAVETAMKLCRIDNLSDPSQPVIVDTFGTFFLSMGGALALAGSVGRFGTFRPSLNINYENIELHRCGLSFLTYLVGRGREREVYWLSRVPVVAAVPSDPKSLKAAASAANILKAKEKDKNLKDQKRGKALLKVEDASIVEEIAWNLEAEGPHPDPNHGPTRGFWRSLLENSFDEMHTMSVNSSLLLVALQGGLTTLVRDLIDEGAGLQLADLGNVTPLMYALFLGDQESVSALITAGADVDAIDGMGNPTITYACHSPLPEDVDITLFGPVGMAGNRLSVTILGGSYMLPILLDAEVDTRVCSSSGNSPLLSAMGLGSVSLVIGGYNVSMSNNSYTEGCAREITQEAVLSLLLHDASLNACNCLGVVPLHIAAARGHTELLATFKQRGAVANAEDGGGYLPIHYVAASCPDGACGVFNYLMEYSRNRPIMRMIFSDSRTGKSKAQKYEEDVARQMNKVFGDAMGAPSIRSVRLSEGDLLARLSNDGSNLVHLCMTAATLELEPFKELVCGGKRERMDFIEFLISKPNTQAMLSCVDSYGMSIMHAASLLLRGNTPVRTLTAQELRSKRVKTYPSLELRLLDVIHSQEGFCSNGECSRPVPLKGFRSEMDSGPFLWTPLHGAIAGGNVDLVDSLLKEGQDLPKYHYAHFLACTAATSVVCDQIITACSSSSCYSALLNTPAPPTWTARPLHLATRSSNIYAVNRLLKCSKVDPNVRDEVTGMTAVHEACQRGDLDVLRTFGNVSDRLDLLTTDSCGMTCIESAIESKNAPMLELLIKMRRNDVLEKVLRSSDTPSLLVQLEVENLEIARALGYSTKEARDGYGEEKNDELHLIPIEVENVGRLVRKITIDQSLSPISMGEFQTIDFSQVGALEAFSKDCDPEMSHMHTNDMLLTSNQVLKLLVDAAYEAGIPDDFHAHPCFSRGLLYTEVATNM